jgi:arabinan endo-1,5-alpha-L-arabinosidase
MLWDQTMRGDGQDQFLFHGIVDGVEKYYMFFGSFIAVWGVEIDPADMVTPIGEQFQIAGDNFEGNYIIEHGGKYWYMASSGWCCGWGRSTYHVTVAVSDHIKGPYLRKDGVPVIRNKTEGTMLLHGDHDIGWVGTGHTAEIIKDDTGRYFIIYHAVATEDAHFPCPPTVDGEEAPGVRPFTRRPLLMDEILWGEDGWPYIENSLPSVTWKRAPHFDPK